MSTKLAVKGPNQNGQNPDFLFASIFKYFRQKFHSDKKDDFSKLINRDWNKLSWTKNAQKASAHWHYYIILDPLRGFHSKLNFMPKLWPPADMLVALMAAETQTPTDLFNLAFLATEKVPLLSSLCSLSEAILTVALRFLSSSS